MNLYGEEQGFGLDWRTQPNPPSHPRNPSEQARVTNQHEKEPVVVQMVMDLRLARAVEEQRAEETAAGKGPAAAGLVLGGEALRGLKPCCVHLELLRKCVGPRTKSDCSNTFNSHNHTVLHTTPMLHTAPFPLYTR